MSCDLGGEAGWRSPMRCRLGKGCGCYGARHWGSLPTSGRCSDCLRSLTGAISHCGALLPRRPE
eukprot:1029751-Prymnesium_polylepis.1